MVVLLPITMDDTHDLLAWRNDPVTRANSRNTSKISKKDHERWMKLHVNGDDPAAWVWIADVNGISVGVISLTRDYEISITVAPTYRGNGYAKMILEQGCQKAGDHPITAEIRRENLTSRYVFEQCGFELTSDGNEFLLYQRQPR